LDDPSARGTLSRVPLSLTPALRYPAFRAFCLGSVASVSGFQIIRFTKFWLIFQLTGSPLTLGYVCLANGLPAIFLNLFAGLAADRMDQRRLIMVSQTIPASLIFLLATITLLDLVKVWHLLTISFLAGAVEAFDQPARQALFPHLIDRSVMASAVASNSSIWPANRIMAPALAGLIIGFAGMTYNIRSLGWMQAGALASICFLGGPFAVAIGGIAVAICALGPAMFNRNVRNLDTLLSESTALAVVGEHGQQTSPSRTIA